MNYILRQNGYVGLAIILFIAAVAKLASIGEFFRVLHVSKLLSPSLVWPASQVVIVLEILTACGILIPATRSTSLKTCLGLFGLFTIYSGWRLYDHIAVPCHCFGANFTLSPIATLVLDVAGVSLCAYLLRGEIRPNAKTVDEWETGLKTFRNNWFSGVGIGALEVSAPEKLVTPLTVDVDRKEREPQSLLIDWLAEMGLGGAALLAADVISIVRLLRSAPDYAGSIAIGGSWIALFLCGIADTPFGIADRPLGNMLFGVLVSSSIGLWRTSQSPEVASRVNQIGSQTQTVVAG